MSARPAAWCAAAARRCWPARRRFASGWRLRWRLGNRRRLRAFAVGQPHVVDRVLDRVQAGARREHPAGEDALDLALQRHFVDLDEGVGLRRLGRRARIADARRHLQRAELHGLVDGDVEVMMRPVILSRPENTAVGLAIFCGGGSTTTSSPGCGASMAGCGAPRGWRWPGGSPGSVCGGGVADRPAAPAPAALFARAPEYRAARPARRVAAARAATGCPAGSEAADRPGHVEAAHHFGAGNWAAARHAARRPAGVADRR